MHQVTVKKWGNSQGVRIPKEILDEMNIHISDVLQLEVSDNSIILKKVFQHKTYEQRVAENGGEVSSFIYDWGEPLGREVL